MSYGTFKYQAQTMRTLPAPLNNLLIGEIVARLWFSGVLSVTRVLTISLFDSQEHHHGADEEHSSNDTGSYHVHLLLQRQTENKHTACINRSRAATTTQSILSRSSIFNSSSLQMPEKLKRGLQHSNTFQLHFGNKMPRGLRHYFSSFLTPSYSTPT